MITKQINNDIFFPRIAELIREGHSVTIQVKGFSMRPYIENCRDKVVLSACSRVNVGDVILAKVSDGRFVLHRVVKKNGDNITLQGDGNVAGTEGCHTSDVVGRAEAFIRKGREKPESTSGLKWKFYSMIWMNLVFMRRYLLAFYRLIWLRYVVRKSYTNEDKG